MIGLQLCVLAVGAAMTGAAIGVRLAPRLARHLKTTERRI